MFDFPSSPAIGAVYSPGAGLPSYRWDGTGWNALPPVFVNTARCGNRAVNGNMAISQENGNTGGSTPNYFAADQFQLIFAGVSGAAVRTQSAISPDGAANAFAAYVSVAKASLAATDQLQIVQNIEGQSVADFNWGTAQAKPAVLRFNACCQTAGTYTVSIGSSNGDQTWLGSFTGDGTMTMKTFVFAIPANTAGTWAKDNTSGLSIHFCYASGSTYVGVAGWQAANKLALPGQTNGAAIISQSLIITDVGLYADPDNTGVPPPWEVPDTATELTRCMRYWETGTYVYYAYQATGSGFGTTQSFNVSKRTTAAMSITGQSITNATNGTLTAQGTNAFMSNAQASATGTCTHTGTYKANARM